MAIPRQKCNNPGGQWWLLLGGADPMYINPMLGKPKNSWVFPSKKCRLHTEIAEITQAFSQLLIGFQVKLPLTKTHQVATFFCHGVDGWCCHELHDTIVATKHPKDTSSLVSCFLLLLEPEPAVTSRVWHFLLGGVQRDVCVGSHEANPWDRGRWVHV